jgi:rubrerythrin
VNPLVEKLTQKGLKIMNKEELLNAYLGEHASAQLYETMAEVEKDPRLAEVFRRIAKTELRHAEKWAAQAKEAGVALPEYKPSWRTRVLMSLSTLWTWHDPAGGAKLGADWHSRLCADGTNAWYGGG